MFSFSAWGDASRPSPSPDPDPVSCPDCGHDLAIHGLGIGCERCDCFRGWEGDS